MHGSRRVAGSLRRDSINRRLADAVARMGPPAFTFRQLQIGDLPLPNRTMTPTQPRPSGADAGTRKILQTWMQRYAAWLIKHAA